MRVVGERARCAIEIKLRVAAGVAAITSGDLDQLVAMFVDDFREAFEDLATLLERQRTKRRAAYVAGVC